MSRCHIHRGDGSIISFFGDVADGFQQAAVVEPVHPFEGRIFHGVIEQLWSQLLFLQTSRTSPRNQRWAASASIRGCHIADMAMPVVATGSSNMAMP